MMSSRPLRKVTELGSSYVPTVDNICKTIVWSISTFSLLPSLGVFPQNAGRWKGSTLHRYWTTLSEQPTKVLDRIPDKAAHRIIPLTVWEYSQSWQEVTWQQLELAGHTDPQSEEHSNKWRYPFSFLLFMLPRPKPRKWCHSVGVPRWF